MGDSKALGGTLAAVGCVVFRHVDKDIEYLLVSPKAREGEPFEYRFPLGNVDGNNLQEMAENIVMRESGYPIVVWGQRMDMDLDSPTGDSAAVYVGTPKGNGVTAPRVKGMKVSWHTFEDCVELVRSQSVKGTLERADAYLRKALPGPLVRRNTRPDYKPIIKRVMDICGESWQQIEYVCENPKSDEPEFFEDRGMDFEAFMSVYPVVAALHHYFRRLMFLVDSHTLCVAGAKLDSRAIVLDRLGTTWDKRFLAAEARFPLAIDALRDLARRAKKCENGLYSELSPEPGSELAAQLKSLLAVYSYSYAAEERLRAIFARTVDGRVVARGLTLCPDRFRDATSSKTLLIGAA